MSHAMTRLRAGGHPMAARAARYRRHRGTVGPALNPTTTVTGGDDAHHDFHVASAVDHNGGVLGVETFDTTTHGYRELIAWLAGFGTISLIGIEGTGSDGAGVTRHLVGNGVAVVEAGVAWLGFRRVLWRSTQSKRSMSASSSRVKVNPARTS